MKKLIALISLLFILSPAAVQAKKQSSPISLLGRVKDALTKMDLVNAYVLWPDSTGTTVDTVKCQGIKWSSTLGEEVKTSEFFRRVARADSVYVFDVECEGYVPQTVTYALRKVGSRESWREMPIIYLERAPNKLKEVTVVASKIKFYNKGDTLVFNADAFQLAEGSMLDGLISQLPGVELNDDGQIKVNGEFVESLLLNGKEFLDGNNQLMLENIAAYTVKDVEVYRGQNEKEKWTNDDSQQRHLTMNVKLKREYNMGWLVNLQGGAGTHGRYLGRAFVNWFTQTHRLTLLGNLNNLNDTRKPGRADTWTPQMMPQGTKSTSMGAVDYRYENHEETVNVKAFAQVEQTRTNDFVSSARTNFLGTTENYEYAYSRSRVKDTRLNTQGSLFLRDAKRSGYLSLQADYLRHRNDGRSLSATFDEEQKEIDMATIEHLYTDPTLGTLDAVVNRSAIRTDGSSRRIDLRATPGGAILLGSGDRLNFETYIRYDSRKEERWNDYTINFGANPVPAERRRQYFDNAPNHLLTSVNNLGYRMRINKVNVKLNYEYRFSDNEKDSYMYALERLADMGVYGTLPSGYLDAFDPANSYTSRLIENKHSIEPSLWYGTRGSSYTLFVNMGASLSLKHQHLNYWRDGRSQLVRQSNFIVTSGNWETFLDFNFGPIKDEEGKTKGYKHYLTGHIEVKPTTPDPFDRLDVINDADPLNITLGNPNLCTAYDFNQYVTYQFTPKESRHPLSEEVTARYVVSTNALTRGYVYDTSTGVRTTRTYNVDGNSTLSLANTLRLQFGRQNQFSLSAITEASLQSYADMIGINSSEPEKSVVDNKVLSQKLDLGWQIGKQSLTARGQLLSRRSTSTRDDFDPINATHYSYGLIANFKLPAGLGLSTDIMAYTRTGYGVSSIDRTDVVWNLRLSYNPPFAKRWVVMIDGFDMLHQLSNVNYAVNASGRMVSYTNTLPRYVLFSLQYRLNIQPKKK